MVRTLTVLAGSLLLAGCAVYPPPPSPPRVGRPPGHQGIPQGQSGKQPSIVVLAPIQYLLISGTSIYYVEGVQPEVFYVNGNFYVNVEGAWHVGPHYEGPWSPLAPNDLPPNLKGQTPGQLKRRASPG